MLEAQVQRDSGRARRGRPDRGVVGPTVSLVIPARNEARNLPHVFAQIPAEVDEVILVDGRSTDDTVEVARALRADVVVVTQRGRGKGDALRCGFAACRGDIVVMADADGSNDLAEIRRFVAALMDGADLAKGSRFLPEGGSADISPLRRMGNSALSGLVNVLFGTRYTDLCYGYNAFWRSALNALSLDCEGFEVETLINVRAALAGLDVTEVPSFESRRLFGKSNLNTFRDGMRVLRTIMSERFGVRPADRPDGIVLASLVGTVGGEELVAEVPVA